MLIDGEMYEALHELADAFIVVVPDDLDVMFDYAYSTYGLLG